VIVTLKLTKIQFRVPAPKGGGMGSRDWTGRRTEWAADKEL